jgi:hypothetical protein
MAEKANGAAAPKKVAAKKVSKMEAVRQAVTRLGSDAGRQQVHDFVRKEFGITMSLDHVSTYLGEIRRKAGKQPGPAAAKPAAVKPTAPKQGRPTKPAAPKAPAAKPPQATAGGASNGPSSGGISVADIRATKELLGRVGAEELKDLIDLLAR